MALTGNKNTNLVRWRSRLNTNASNGTYYTSAIVGVPTTGGVLQLAGNIANFKPLGIFDGTATRKIDADSVGNDRKISYSYLPIANLPYSKSGGNDDDLLGKKIYASDDNTLTESQPNNNPLPVGTIIAYDDKNVMVDFGEK